MALEAQWRITPPLVYSAHAIAVYLGALEVPKPPPSAKAGDEKGEELIDADDPDFLEFMQNLARHQS